MKKVDLQIEYIKEKEKNITENGVFSYRFTMDYVKWLEGRLVKKLIISDVVVTSKCDCIHSGSCRYEEVILHSKEICRHKE